MICNMIYINHQKRCIFIHIPKTGGSYIGPTLVKYYGFVSYLPVIHNRRPDHNAICQTNKYNRVVTNNFKYDNSFFNKTIGLVVYCKTSEYLNRAMNMDKEKWNTYTKFCFIRNPYDRVLSGWNHFETIFKRKSNFYNYLSQPDIKNKVSDIEYGHVFMNQKIQIQDEHGNCGVDLIGRFENLEEDFKLILSQLGFMKINHVEKKVNVSNKSGNEKKAFEIKTIQKINELFDDDLSTFHYKKVLV